MFFTTGPQGPSAFCNGITCAELQGDWITECLIYMRSNSFQQIEATQLSEENWKNYLIDASKDLLMLQSKSWYMGANIPEKTKELLIYPLGLPAYKEKASNSLKNNLQGFVLT